MSLQKSSRKRGVILSATGWNKFQSTKDVTNMPQSMHSVVYLLLVHN
ncbi:hypothetical protein [Scytonema sp. NUACC21]